MLVGRYFGYFLKCQIKQIVEMKGELIVGGTDDNQPAIGEAA
jgi:hypothetical protein